LRPNEDVLSLHRSKMKKFLAAYNSFALLGRVLHCKTCSSSPIEVLGRTHNYSFILFAHHLFMVHLYMS
jgi:hypothetical protein